MGKLDEKITRAAHIKRHTVGTSNEISFSVLDAAKNALDGDEASPSEHGPFGRIALFTLPGKRKKPVATPTKPEGLHLPGGDFVAVDDDVALPFSSSKRGSDVPGVRIGAIGSSSESSSSAATSAKPDAMPSAVSSLAAPKVQRSPEEEIARRKARRKLSKIVAIAVIAAISLALIGAGGVYLYQDHEKFQTNVSRLDESLAMLAKVDETLLTLDDAVEHPFDDGAEEKRARVRDQLSDATAELDSADEKARIASSELRDSKDKEAANQAVAAISARRSMLETGTVLMQAADGVEEAAKQIDEAWSAVLSADEKVREAAELVTETTEENVTASKEKTTEARTLLETARDGFHSAQETYDVIDVSALVAYVDKRIEALGFALASDDAFLARNKEEAAAQNEAYNIADAEAATLAKALPSDPSSTVFEAYEEATVDLQKAYSTARSQAGAADAFLRDYLGTESK